MTEKEPTLRDLIRAVGAARYRFRGARYVAKGRYDRALADFDHAIELYPDHTSGFAHRGNAYRLMERYDEALADFDHAIELGTADAWFFMARGTTYFAMARYDQALADYDRAIELNPTEDEFAAARAEICQLTGHADTDDAPPSKPGTKAT